MTLGRQTEAEILEATARSLEEQGYDVFLRPDSSFLPPSLRLLQPDGIAIREEDKLIIQIAQEGPSDAKKVAELQSALRAEPGWKLHLVVGLLPSSSWISLVDEVDIAKVISRASNLIGVETSAALLMAWAALEALGRKRMPNEFAKPQSPGRIVERMASEGMITPSEAAFLRTMAQKRNAFIHGDLMQSIGPEEVRRFLDILHDLLQPATT